MDLTAALCSREFRREDGAAMHIGRLLVDAGYVPDVVYNACSHSPYAAILMPSRGEEMERAAGFPSTNMTESEVITSAIFGGFRNQATRGHSATSGRTRIITRRSSMPGS